MKYIPALDGLRAYAVALVLAAHFPAIVELPFTFFLKDVAGGLRVGYLGVDIFFVLSGFLITSILLDEKRKGVFSFRRFYIKRSLRIFPIFYLTLLFCVIVFPLSTGEFLANAFYVSNYYYVFVDDPSPLRHTWSLSVEEQFYLIWPLVFWLMPLNRATRYLLVGIPVIVVTAVVLFALLLDAENFRQMVVRGLPFRVLSLGAGAAFALNRDKLSRLQPGHLLLAIPVLLSLGVLSRLTLGPGGRAVVELLVLSGAAIGIFLLALRSSELANPVSRWLLESKPIVYLGRISYGIYLYHLVVLFAFSARESQSPEGVPISIFISALALSILIPAVSFRFIESPLLRLKPKTPSAPKLDKTLAPQEN